MAIEFNEPARLASRQSPRRAKGLTGLFIKTGLVKSEGGARLLMLFIAVIALAAVFFLLMNGPKEVPLPNPADYATWPR